jgi:hypothetical protein
LEEVDAWERRLEDVDSGERNGHGWERNTEELHRDEREDLKM